MRKEKRGGEQGVEKKMNRWREREWEWEWERKREWETEWERGRERDKKEMYA